MAFDPMYLPWQPQWLGFHLDYCSDRLQEMANLLGREVVYNWNGRDMSFLPKQSSWESYQSWPATNSVRTSRVSAEANSNSGAAYKNFYIEILPMSDAPKTDLKGTQCTQCNLGEYQETSIYDDWQGNLHCTQCNHKTKRYESVSD